MQVPMGGIGYGLVRYLADGDGEKLADLPQPQVSFNYLGQMGPLFEGVAMFRSVDDNVGTMIDPGAVRTQLVHIAAEILTRRLRVSFEYSENFHRPSTIEELSGRFSEALRGLLALEKPIGPSSGGSDASG
jgi:non-ribosomal peptide synthase protein (TIGR01720 family)